MSDPAAEAIARGDATMAEVAGFRDQLFEPCMALLLLIGREHTHACIASVVEHSAIVLARKAQGLPVDGEMLPLPPQVAS